MEDEMGKVFSWTEIKNGEIPLIDNFKKVREFIVDKVQNYECVDSGIFCGSVLKGNNNIRSDFDFLLAYWPNKPL